MIEKSNYAIELSEAGGVPFLMENGLPYPTATYRTDVHRQCLNDSFVLEPKGQSVSLPLCFGTEKRPLPEESIVLTGRFRINLDDLPVKRLVIESVFHSILVTVNGKKIGESHTPHLPSVFSLADVLFTDSENRIELVISHQLDETTLPIYQFMGHKPGWQLFPGVLGDVYIESLPKCYCFKADISSEKLFEARLLFWTDGCPVEYTYRLHDENSAAVLEGEGTATPESDSMVAPATLVYKVENPRQWSPANPQLYYLEVACQSVTQTYRFGIRTVKAAGGQLLLNGTPFVLRGICRHQETDSDGILMPISDLRREFELSSELGANFMRLTHYPHSDLTYELADERGFGIWSEIGNYQAGMGVIQGIFGKSLEIRKSGKKSIFRLLRSRRQMTNPMYLKHVKSSIRKMIERLRNHPSIMFWGVGNECWSYGRGAAQVLRELRTLCLSLDNSRVPAYAAFCLPIVANMFETSFKIFDVVCCNEYFGWYYGKRGQAEGFWRRLKQKYPEKALILTETGSDAFIADNASLERQCHMLESHLRLLGSPLSGICVWLFKDFRCPEYGVDEQAKGRNSKGLLTHNYEKKPAFSTVQHRFHL